MGKKMTACRILVAVRRVRHIEVNLREIKMGSYGLDSSASGCGPVEASCERGNEPSGSIKCWEILE
jgi:hypothetical protein